GPSEDGAFWLSFLRRLVARGLGGVQLVVSDAHEDAHEGLKAASAAVRHGASWQRCRVQFLRHALALVPKSAAQLVAATIRTVFAQPDAPSAREQWRRGGRGLRPPHGGRGPPPGGAEAEGGGDPAFPAQPPRPDRA